MSSIMWVNCNKIPGVVSLESWWPPKYNSYLEPHVLYHVCEFEENPLKGFDDDKINRKIANMATRKQDGRQKFNKL